jgi:hypothetical protein
LKVLGSTTFKTTQGRRRKALESKIRYVSLSLLQGMGFCIFCAQSAWRDGSIIHALFCEHECFLPQNKSGSWFTESVHHFFCWVAWVGCSLLFKSFSSSAFWWREFLFTGCQHSEIGLWAWFWRV